MHHRAKNRELTQTLLFLGTATAAVTQLKQIVKGSKTFIDEADLQDNHRYHRQLRDSLRDDQIVLSTWVERLFEAQFAFIGLAAEVAIGRHLPLELQEIIRSMLIDEGTFA